MHLGTKGLACAPVKVGLTPGLVEVFQEVRLASVNPILIRPGGFNPLRTGGDQVYFPLLQRRYEREDRISVVGILWTIAAKIRRYVRAEGERIRPIRFSRFRPKLDVGRNGL
jgi:hypothetical protein